MSSPRVTVILGTYNQAKYLPTAIESVLSQTFTDWELLVINNASPDNTQEVTRAYECDPRIRCFHFSENGNVSRRLNDAIRVSRGEFISILYGDDYYLPGKLKHQVRRMDELGPDVGVIYGPGYRLFDSSGEQTLGVCASYSGMIFPDLLRTWASRTVWPIGALIRKRCFGEAPFFEGVFSEGESNYLRLALYHRFHHDPEPLTVMREHESNMGKAVRKNVEDFMVVLADLQRSPAFPASCRSTIDALRAEYQRNLGWTAIRIADDPTWAFSCFQAAVRSNSSEIFHPRLILGCALALTPGPIRRLVNRLGHRFSSEQGHRKLRDSYS